MRFPSQNVAPPHRSRWAAVFCCALISLQASGAAWTVKDVPNNNGPGRRVDIRENETLRASLIHGEGQMKPYLHVYGEKGELLTNGGLTPAGERTGKFPHHRGIFIGWKIKSDLGTHDLWHMTGGAHIDLAELEVLEGASDHGIVRARFDWHAPEKDTGDTLLLTETRTLTLSRTADRTTQIDTHFSLMPARDLQLAGDLQHSGIHFRAANEVSNREKETAYLHDPETVNGPDLRWCRLLFPIGDHWYTAQQMNSPANPVQQLSMRAYGRFGYFFRKPLRKGQRLDLDYRFVISQADPPGTASEPIQDKAASSRAACDRNYRAFLQALAR